MYKFEIYTSREYPLILKIECESDRYAHEIAESMMQLFPQIAVVRIMKCVSVETSVLNIIRR